MITLPAAAPAVASGFKNRLINGAWRFDQVNEGAAYTVPNTGVNTQAVDGWSGFGTTLAVFTMQRVADPDYPSLFALKVACTTSITPAGNDRFYLFTALEGYDAADLKAGTATASQITISFDMKMAITGAYGITIYNSAANRWYVGNVTQNVANTREPKTLTLTLDTSGTWLYTNGVGLYMSITLAAGVSYQGTANTWGSSEIRASAAQCNFMSSNTNVGYIGRIQLEKGGTASAFEETSQQADLARCQRHCFKTYDAGVAPGTSTTAGAVQNSADSGANVYLSYRYPVPMRDVPVVTDYSTTGASGKIRNLSTGADVTPAVLTTGQTGRSISATLGGATQQAAGHLVAIARLA